MGFRCFFITVLLLMAGLSNSAHADDYEVTICDSCSTTTQFRNAALATGHIYKDVVVINLARKQSKAFRITKPFNTEDFIEYIRPINVPSGTAEAIDKYHELSMELLRAYEWIKKFGGDGEYVQANIGKTGSSYINRNNFIEQIKVDAWIQAQGACQSNGCGTPNHWSYTIIPDSPFLSACNQHDVCYCSGQSKGFCDQQFLFNMNLKIKSLMLSLNGGTYHPAKKVEGVLFAKALYTQAEAYYTAVSRLSAAKEAYCAASGNSNAIECRPEPSGAVDDRYQGTSSGSYIHDGRQVMFRCTTYDVYTKQTGEYSGSYTVCNFA